MYHPSVQCQEDSIYHAKECFDVIDRFVLASIEILDKSFKEIQQYISG